MAFACDWVDAFTDRPFGGNGCVVVHEADGIGLQDRLRLVRETSLSECAYLVGSDKADFGARYYLAEREIPMAGHPTVATVRSLLHRGMVAPSDEFTLEVGAGVMPIGIGRDGTITMTQAAPVFAAAPAVAEIAAIYGLEPADFAAEPQVVSTGTPFVIALLRDKEALKRASLDERGLAGLRDRTGATWMEPFLVTLGGATGAGDTFSRLLLPPPMPPEDPFTGSATGCMGAYLWANGLIDTPRLVAEQGHWMGRPGQAQVEVLGPPGAISGVRVGGHAVVLMSGELLL